MGGEGRGGGPGDEDDDGGEGPSPARPSPDRRDFDDDDEDDDDGSSANVYSVSYELHRIAPQILTTVIGTVSTSLLDTDVARRWQAARLLGRLFGARTSDIASRFGPCFREWLRRSYGETTPVFCTPPVECHRAIRASWAH